MKRLAIVEDNHKDAQKLHNICSTFFDDLNLPIEIDLFYDADGFRQTFLDKNYTIIFMDIYLKDASGVELSKWVRKHCPNVIIIFVTTSNEFVWEAFRLHAFDYILKPFEKEKIDKVINDILRFEKLRTFTLELIVGRQTLKINAYDISYLMSDGHHTNITTQNLTLRAYGSYSKFKEKLSHIPDFIECNRGILVNMNDVDQQLKDVFIMKDQRSIPLRRNERSHIINTFVSFRLQKNRITVQNYD